MEHKLDNIHEYFQLPISFNESKMSVPENVVTDLELQGAKEGKSLYNSIFECEDIYARATCDMWREYYTHDKVFLKDTQKLLSSDINYNIEPLHCWNKIKGEAEFDEKYHFINMRYFKFLNYNSIFLQLLSLYKFASPLITLVYPIFVLFIPLIILKYYNKVNVSFDQYYGVVKMFLMNNSVVKLFTEFSLQHWRQSFYLLLSAFMYMFSIYQNIMSCIHFHANMKHINTYIIELRNYTQQEIELMDRFHEKCKNLSTYQKFLETMNTHKQILISNSKLFEMVNSYKWDFHNLSHLGYSLKMLYMIYHDSSFHNAIMYSFGFNGYIQNMKDIQYNLKQKYIAPASFGKKTKFNQAYYPHFKTKKHVKNTYSFEKNLIISGPNASGKTTLIKSTLFNVLLSQQLGCGFFKRGCIKPYKFIHSYLNIPDTSDRDSLFQAEARRCREIIRLLDKNKKASHFCIFDELYSGTNPYEANASAYAFIKYMTGKNIDFMLTTHFVELCESLDDDRNIDNVQMDIQEDNDRIKYLYTMKSGISRYRGGVHVLKDLDYPSEIIELTREYLKV